MVKILFTDIDGTLINSDKTISQYTYDKIIEMIKQNHKLVLASGRPLNSILDVKEKLGLPDKGLYVTAFNGALLYDCENKKILHEERVQLNDAQKLFDMALESGIHVHTYDDDGHILTCEMDKEIAYYQKKIIGNPIATTELSPYFKSISGPYKILTINLEKEDSEKYSPALETFRAKIQNSPLNNKLNCAFSNSFYLEFFNKKAGKGNGLLKLCQLLDIPVENSVAAGDAENDISMLNAAGVGAAMINGDDIVKEKAAFVTTKDCNHDGITEIIDKLVL